MERLYDSNKAGMQDEEDQLLHEEYSKFKKMKKLNMQALQVVDKKPAAEQKLTELQA